MCCSLLREPQRAVTCLNPVMIQYILTIVHLKALQLHTGHILADPQGPLTQPADALSLHMQAPRVLLQAPRKHPGSLSCHRPAKACQVVYSRVLVYNHQPMPAAPSHRHVHLLNLCDCPLMASLAMTQRLSGVSAGSRMACGACHMQV